MQPRHVVILCYPQVNVVDVAGPLQVFTSANQWLESQELPTYRCRVMSLTGGSITSSSGLPLLTESLATAGSDIDTLIVPGGPQFQSAETQALVPWVASQAATVRRLCSVCTGAFILAASGVLDGRRAVTHWMYAELLQSRFPRIQVEIDPIYINQGNIWTSAGVTSGIDMTLALVEEDCGHTVSIHAARQMVVYLKRPGGQSQFSVPLNAQSTATGGVFGTLHAWLNEHLHEKLTVERLADQVCMSPRTFARRYTAAVGQTPARTLERMRVEAACRLLEGGGTGLKRIAARCGFTNEQNLRRAFLRQLGVGPTEYRERFAGLRFKSGSPPIGV